jgi:hypothetical protein
MELSLMNHKKFEEMMKRQGIPAEARLHISPGEINSLYWFIQGGIMEPETRQALRKAWGFCERHAWVTMLVEAAFRPGFLHGPSILYEDILSRAVSAFNFSGPLQNPRLRMRLREKGPCIMCEMGYGPETKSTVRREILETGGNPTALRAFALETREYWSRTVCGRCSHDGSWQRCRRHLLEELTGESGYNLTRHREFLRNMFTHLVAFTRSFQWGYHNTETDEDKASLISAVGWCSGWRPLLQIIGSHEL